MTKDSIRCVLIVGTRPEFLKMLPVIRSFQSLIPAEEYTVIFSGQHADLIKHTDSDYLQFINEVIDFNSKGLSLENSFSRLQELIGIKLKEFPNLEFIIVQGDTSTAAAGALVGKLMGIKVVHIEAGLRTDSLDPFPEEFYRKLITLASSFHFAPTSLSAEKLLNENIDSENICVVGNTGIDQLKYTLRLKSDTFPVKDKTSLKFLITLHRRENNSVDLSYFIDLINRLCLIYPGAVFTWVTHPSINQAVLQSSLNKSVNLIPPMNYEAFCLLLNHTDLMITDSGGLQEEGVVLGIPMVVYRNNTERPEAHKAGFPLIISKDPDFIINAIPELLKSNEKYNYKNVYGDGRAAHDIIYKFLDWLNIVPTFETVVVGGGPGGTGPILSAIKNGQLGKLSEKGLAVIEKGSHLVRGNLTSFKINSDTLANVFFECLEGDVNTLTSFVDLMAYKDLFSEYNDRHIPLPLLESYLDLLGEKIEILISAHKSNFIFYHSTVVSLERVEGNKWKIKCRCNGGDYSIIAANVIMAPGANPVKPDFKNLIKKKEVNELLKGIHPDAVFYSDDLLKGYLDIILNNLFTNPAERPPVLILGASHSAFSCAWYLKQNFSNDFGDVHIAGYDNPAIFYASSDDALIDGYTDFDQRDICPVTGRVFRLGGLRGDGRELYRRMKGLTTPIVTDVKFWNLNSVDLDKLKSQLSGARICIVAYGYKFNMPEVITGNGTRIGFAGEKSGHWVDQSSQLVSEDGSTIQGLYAIGLSTGFIPSGELGGEPSFEKQTNGLWYYQNLLGGKIVSALIE